VAHGEGGHHLGLLPDGPSVKVFTLRSTGEQYVRLHVLRYLESTDTGTRLQLRSGAVEWFPSAHIACHSGRWYIKRWLADKRRAEKEQS